MNNFTLGSTGVFTLEGIKAATLIINSDRLKTA